MAQTKHTPGPWHVADSQTYAAEVRFTTVRRKEVTLARISTPQGRRDQALANALLIAAAPDLLDALRDLWAWQGSVQESTSDALSEKVQAAIAKSTGRQP